MATADKLKKYVTAIANAIRAKEGSTEKINPQDFVQRIENLQVGGGTSEEERIYISKEELDKADALISMTLKMFAESAKYDDSGDLKISPMGIAIEEDFNHGVEWVAYCINLSLVIASPQIQGKIGELLTMQGVDVYQLPLMTKEQFYTLE